LRKLFQSLRNALARTGPLRVDAVKSNIRLISGHAFGGVQVRGDHLRVGFLADHEIASPRVFGSERLGPRLLAYHVAVRSAKDVDAKLLGWLAEAQALRTR
jgi:hypothetical protein